MEIIVKNNDGEIEEEIKSDVAFFITPKIIQHGKGHKELSCSLDHMQDIDSTITSMEMQGFCLASIDSIIEFFFSEFKEENEPFRFVFLAIQECINNLNIEKTIN